MSESAGMVGGRYRLLRTIGQGGMGTVWQAHDEVLGRDVAVKEVHPPPDMTGPERDVFSVRTFREARAAGRVAHPGVATVYDVLEERGHPWIVMQLVRSRTLGELVRDEGPLPPARAAAVGLQLLEALRAAHAAGVLHRDVKPDNVLLADDGRAVLTDFGIATTEDEVPVTRTGILVGTPAFIAPERAAGGRAVPESDLWSLGVTLYVAVEGHSPFQRSHALATLGAILHSDPPPLARAGVLAPVLMGLLRKDPARRMTLEEARRRLHAIVAGSAPEQTAPFVVPPQPGPPASESAPSTASGTPRRSARSGRTLTAALVAGLVAGVVALGAAVGGAAWWSHRYPAGGPAKSVPAVVSSPPPSGSAPSERQTGQPSGQPTGVRPTGVVTGPAEQSVRRSAEPTRDRERGEPTGGPSREESSREPTHDPSPTGSGDPPDSRTPGQVDPSDGGKKKGKKGKKGNKPGNAGTKPESGV